MPCIVPTCGAIVGTMRPFPQDVTISQRWLDAIYIGCGVKVGMDSDNMNSKEICLWHFGIQESEEILYKEPNTFYNCKEEQDVKIDSCRLCLRFYLIRDMVSKNGELSGTNINVTLKISLRIDLQSNDFLGMICLECLARLQLLESIQKDFRNAKMKRQNLITIIQDNAKEILRTKDLPSSPDLTQEAGNKSNSEVDGSIDDDSNEEWTPSDVSNTFKNHTESSVNSISINSCDGKNKYEGSLREIIFRKCYICQLVLEDANQLSTHFTDKHGHERFNRCDECSLDFYVLSTYNQHLARHDENERPKKCSFCTLRFKWNRSLKIHENKQHGTNHVMKKLVDNDIPSTCEQCGTLFKSVKNLRNHVKRIHSSKDKPKCNICSRTCASQSSLERHMLQHTNKKPYACNNCDASFRNLLDVRHHVQKVHEGINPHVCRECNKEFNTNITLSIHRRTVHLNRPRPRVKSSKRKRVSEPNPDTTTCKICNKQFVDPQRLRRHIAEVHGQQKFNCSICLVKTYKSQSALQQHMNLHIKGKQFSCEFCNKRFGQKYQLTLHRRLHTGEKPFECQNCSARYSHDGAFGKHKKNCLPKVAEIKQETADTKLSGT